MRAICALEWSLVPNGFIDPETSEIKRRGLSKAPESVALICDIGTQHDIPRIDHGRSHRERLR